MNSKPESKANDNHSRWNMEPKIMLQKYEDLFKSGVKKNEPLGKYQLIFDMLKQMS